MQSTVGQGGRQSNLLHLVKRFQDALGNRELPSLRTICAEDVVLHKDDLTLCTDVLGRDAVADYFEQRWTRYTYKHHGVAQAADEDAKVAFSFDADEDIQLRQEFQHLLPEAYKPCTIAGISKYEVDRSNQIRAIWFLRELSTDELYEKFGSPANFPPRLNFDPMIYRFPSIGPKLDKDNAAIHRRVMEQYACIWETGDVSLADAIMVEDVRTVGVLHGFELHGREAFKDLVIRTMQGGEQPTSQVPGGTSAGVEATSSFAVTPTDKAFFYFTLSGLDPAAHPGETKYGLSMVVFTDAHLIDHIITFSQLPTAVCVAKEE